MSEMLDGEQVRELIERAYGLRLVAPLAPLPAGVHSRAWLASTDAGPWVAKLGDPRSDPPAKLEAQAALFAFLDARGVAVPFLRPTLDGRPVAQLHDGLVERPFTLLRYEQLRRLDPATATAEEVGQIMAAVARLHIVLEAYPGRAAIVADTAGSRNEWGRQTAGAFPLPVNSSLRAAFTPDELRRLAEVDDAVVVALAARAPDLAGLRWAALHGDLNFEHAQCLPDGRVYLFDFGDLCWGPVAHDLAQLLQCLFRDSAISTARWAELRRWALDGYASHAQLAAADRAAVDYFVLNRVVAQARYIAELSTNGAAPTGAAAIRRSYRLAEQLLAGSL